MRFDPVHIAVTGSSAGEASPVPLADDRWRHLLAETESHRTIGWLVAAVVDGRLPATPDQEDGLFSRHERLMHQALVLEDEARSVARLLDPHGVRPVVLKGVAASHLDHRDPALRTFQDVDLLIAPAEIDITVDALSRAGCARDLPPRRSDWDRRFAKDITFVSPRGAEIDLHRTLVPGPFGFTIDLAGAHANTVPFELGGVTVRALAPEGRALAAALALTVGEPRPRLAAALDMMTALERHAVETEPLVELARQWGVQSLLSEAVLWTTRVLETAVVPDGLVAWAGQTDSSRSERFLRRSYRSAGGSNTTTLLAAPLGMRRWPDRFAYLRGLTMPGRDYRLARARAARPNERRTALRELMGRS